YKELLKLGTSITAAKRHPAIARINEKLALMWQSKEVYDLLIRYIDLAFDLAQRWRDQYEAFKKERNILDFNDLEKYLLDLLRDRFAAAEIGAKYRYVFVDEFQDCSPIQIKIFSALSELAEHSYWVGDMKQSIFGFRGSDTALTDAVIKTIEGSLDKGCNIDTLPNSWRSVPEIVEFCNSIFVQAFAPEIPSDRVRLNPVKLSDPSVEPLVIWNLDSKEQIAGMIANMLGESVRPSEIAILNRRGDPLNEFAQWLTERNIPVNLSTEPIMSSKAALLAKAILSVADNDADSLAKGEVAFLLDPHYTTENIISDTLAHINPDTGRPDHAFLDEVPVLKRLSKIRSRLTQQSIAEFVESVILELNLYEEAMKCCDRKESVNVLNAIIGAAKTYEEVCLRLDTTPTVKGFIDYLGGGSVTLPGDPDGVVLLTMHKSKGLEWKYVIVTSLESNPADVKKIMKREVFGVHFRRTTPPTEAELFPEVNISLMPFVYGSGNTKVPVPLDQIIGNKPEFAQICKDKIAEETRLLYVAMTRPTHQLVLSLSGKTPLRWLADMGLSGYDSVNSLTDSFGFSSITLEDESEIEVTEMPGLTYRIENSEVVHERRDHSPSMLEGKLPVKSHRDFGRRIPLGKLPKDVRWTPLVTVYITYIDFAATNLQPQILLRKSSVPMA
ncbi:MAG: UvrD-helicase domain-containing protein, partial [Muribaculaceae bacterium]|nr:UvrD-helicase domain-containing protein [Muribaculaceae bacterium]